MEIFCIFPSDRIARFGNHEGTEEKVREYAEEFPTINYFFAEAETVRSN
jgi:hypothetical protein